MTIKAWDWDKQWKCIRISEGHTHYIMNLAFNPKDTNTFASSCLDRTIKMWSLGASAPNFTLDTQRLALALRARPRTHLPRHHAPLPVPAVHVHRHRVARSPDRLLQRRRPRAGGLIAVAHRRRRSSISLAVPQPPSNTQQSPLHVHLPHLLTQLTRASRARSSRASAGRSSSRRTPCARSSRTSRPRSRSTSAWTTSCASAAGSLDLLASVSVTRRAHALLVEQPPGAPQARHKARARALRCGSVRTAKDKPSSPQKTKKAKTGPSIIDTDLPSLSSLSDMDYEPEVKKKLACAGGVQFLVCISSRVPLDVGAVPVSRMHTHVLPRPPWRRMRVVSLVLSKLLAMLRLARAHASAPARVSQRTQ
ncbi:hypothetical protein DFH11DRAFT_1732559 [Phellopilus nigrolimitatus]|nr:hypothetical protein DFH11DRAFT_1732559 [Phellopilus nigrolimitatus]